MKNDKMTGIEFEDILFHQLLCYPNVSFETIDLVGKPKGTLAINFKHFKMLQNPPKRITEDVLLRCFEGYPRFDFIFGRTFIQVSISSFTIHNSKSAAIELAFENKNNQKNQIEDYL